MCGIAGFIDFQHQLGEKELTQMTDALLHRGPDAGGYRVINHESVRVGLGHRRLSIIDLSVRGAQPMTRGSATISFNGEIYNYKELRDELILKGVEFRSDSDTEVILAAFELFGEDAISRLNGMFAFALYCGRRNKLYLVRDRAGVKPLYYYNNADAPILFASELKSFSGIPGFKKQIDEEALALFFSYGYVPTPFAIFKDVYKVQEGHYLEIDLGERSVIQKPYWKLADSLDMPEVNLPEEEIIDETERRLKTAIEYRMIADVPVGVFLSGGYDSSLVAAMVQKERTKKLKTFTIGFENPRFDESKNAREVAKYLGTDHREYICTESEAKEIIPKLPLIYDEPFADSSAIPTFLVSKIAREEVKVVLSADGGDEQFIGYSRYTKAIQLAKLMALLGESGSKLLGTVCTLLAKGETFKRIALSLMDGRVAAIPLHQTRSLLREDLEGLFNGGEMDPRLICPNSRKLNSIFVTEYLGYMQNDILVKVDRATMSNSLEGREPLLDYQLAEWAMKLPIKMKYRKKTLKYLLKTVTHRYLPQHIMDRPKQGFGVPIHDWLRSDLSPLVDAYISKARISEQGLFSSEFVESRRQIYFGRRDSLNDCFIWNMLVFQMWYDEWMS